MEHIGTSSTIHKAKNWKTVQISSHDPENGNADYVTLQPGETYRLGEINGSGTISRVWFALMSADPLVLRYLLLKFSWDGEEDPSVYAPMGDFFGVGFAEYVHHFNMMQGMTSGGIFSYWPMPFNNKAILEVENRSSQPVTHLYYNIQYHKTELDEEDLYFHCRYHRENPTEIDKNYTILRATGRGHYAGCVLSMQSYDKGSLLMLQGDEYIKVDDEEQPSVMGTGTEDYFQGGWFWNKGPFHAPYHGLTVMDEVNSRYSAYRLHIPDPIPFADSISVEIEHGHANMLQQDYSSVAYWYQTEPHNSDFGRMPRDQEYLTPIGTKDGAYLMSEVVQDTEGNRERRDMIHRAAVLRLELRESKKKGVIPEWFNGVDEVQFMKADYYGLVNLVNLIEKRKNSRT
jgi:D-arabinan exo alpha-(1,3)/(1,5)-arabinofuranosidase (non-reducing end)